jgi:hypothetical protein
MSIAWYWPDGVGAGRPSPDPAFDCEDCGAPLDSPHEPGCIHGDDE